MTKQHDFTNSFGSGRIPSPTERDSMSPTTNSSFVLSGAPTNTCSWTSRFCSAFSAYRCASAAPALPFPHFFFFSFLCSTNTTFLQQGGMPSLSWPSCSSPQDSRGAGVPLIPNKDFKWEIFAVIWGRHSLNWLFGDGQQLQLFRKKGPSEL